MDNKSLLSLLAICVLLGVTTAVPGVSHPTHPTQKASHKHGPNTTPLPPTPGKTPPTSTVAIVTTGVTQTLPTSVVTTVTKNVATSGAATVTTDTATTSGVPTTAKTSGVATVTNPTATVVTYKASPSVTTATTASTSTTTASTSTTTTTTPKPTSPPTTTPDPRINMTVCYDDVGCFDNYPPFNNALLDLPVDPKVIQTGFWFYTRDNNVLGAQEFLDYTDPTSVTALKFDPKKLTKVVVHGFGNNGNTTWVQKFRSDLLIKGDFNVIVVDWGLGAVLGHYNQAVANTRLVGTQLKLVLEMLQGAGLHLEDVHLMGHSLGAHTSGYTGRLLGGQIGRISGMDPADPEFANKPLIVRLDKTDAVFVDIAHTNAEQLGIITPSGHVDFYLNGGKIQPGCPIGNGSSVEAMSCNHARSHDFYIESLSTTCPFTAYPCPGYAAFQKAQCLTCGQQGCSQFGYYADQYHARGLMYLNTAPKSPYCGYHYGVELSVPSNMKATRGKLYINLIGQWESSGFIQLTGDDPLNPGVIIIRVVVSSKEVGDITAVEMKYVKHSGFWFGAAENTFALNRVLITSGENGFKYLVCMSGQTITHNTPVRTQVATRPLC